MIAKSDLIILMISASALGLGIYRWQQNTAAPSTAAVTAPSTSATPSTGPSADPSADSGTASLPDATPAEPLAGRPAREGTGAAGGTGSTGAEDDVIVRRVPPADDGSSALSTAAEASSDAALEGARSGGGTDPLAATPGDADDPALYGRYRVREGDYLGRIAERFGTSVATLRSINDIEDNLIFVDQELRYPLPAN